MYPLFFIIAILTVNRDHSLFIKIDICINTICIYEDFLTVLHFEKFYTKFLKLALRNTVMIRESRKFLKFTFFIITCDVTVYHFTTAHLPKQVAVMRHKDSGDHT